MPELPEVEIVRRGLEPAMVGARLVRVAQHRPDLRFPFPPAFTERLEGRTVTALDRRAKYLLAHLNDGCVLVIHLGMSGRLSIVRGATAHTLGDYIYDHVANPAHDHVEFEFTGGHRIRYNDPRRFGFMLLIEASALPEHPMFANLGVEPLGNSLDARYLARMAAGRRTDLKAFLLDQRTIAGLGNIYVSEALHRAQLAPRRSASTLVRTDGTAHPRAQRLVTEIKAVLADAIRAGGSSLRDYRQADGARGGFQNQFAVYGRDGEACLREGCSGTIRRIVQAQRATFYCPRCQR